MKCGKTTEKPVELLVSYALNEGVFYKSAREYVESFK